jgi:hypothetical protein
VKVIDIVEIFYVWMVLVDLEGDILKWVGEGFKQASLAQLQLADLFER